MSSEQLRNRSHHQPTRERRWREGGKRKGDGSPQRRREEGEEKGAAVTLKPHGPPHLLSGRRYLPRQPRKGAAAHVTELEAREKAAG